jgi:outer membrane protein assembly factor BamD (BamD/ComL family)
VTLVGCLQWQSSIQTESQQPEKVLYDQAMDAAAHSKFDVAGLTLQTLINTYPDSDYATKAKLAIQDPRIAAYEDQWITSGGGMTFFSK